MPRRAQVTASVAKQNRAWLDREIRRAHIKAQRAKLRELRAAIRSVKKRRALWRRAAKNHYARLRVAARQAARAERARLLEELRRKRDAERRRLSAEHLARRERIAAEFASAEKRARKLLAEERQFQREMRSYEQLGKQRKAPRSTARERAQESDDQVRQNLTPAEVVIFNKVRKHIKAGPRRTRTEAFAEWLQENPDEAASIQYGKAEFSPRELAKLEREYYARKGELTEPSIRKAARRHAKTFLGNGKEAETLDEYLAGVPF